jgi:long-chain acyl-CoA synthetase
MYCNKDSIYDLWEKTSDFYCIDDQGKHDNKETKIKVINFYEILLKHGIVSRDVIIYLTKNSVEAIIVLFGILKADCVLAPVSCKIPIYKLMKYLHLLNAKAVILTLDDFSTEDLSILLIETNVIIHKNEKWCFIPKKNSNIPDSIPSSSNCRKMNSDIAFILFTSGTKNEAKAAMFTNERVIKMLQAIYDYMMPGSADVFIITKQVQHVSTWIGEILMSIFIDAALSIRKTSLLLPRLCIENAVKDKATILFTNPNLLAKLINVKCCKKRLNTLHSVYVSGSPLDKRAHEQADKYFLHAEIYNVYGLTEAGPRVLAQGSKTGVKYGSVGKPVKGVSVFIKQRIGESAEYTEIIEPGVTGELFVDSPYAVLGYWPDEVFDGSLLHTGDTGYFDEDGFYYIIGRSDEIIFYHSHNINPFIIESYICSYEHVETCVVFDDKGIGQQDKIVALYTTSNNMDINQAELYGFVRKHLEPYECPIEIHRTDKSFISEYGKVQRNRAKEYYINEIKKRAI